MGKSSSDSMKELCNEIIENALDPDVEYDYLKSAFDEELPIIYERGLADDFLLAQEISEAIKEVVVFPEFIGYASSSIVANLLGITEVNPKKYGLKFKDVMGDTAKDYMWGYHLSRYYLYDVFKELKTHFQSVELSANDDCLTVNGLKIFVETSFERIRTIGLCMEHCKPF